MYNEIIMHLCGIKKKGGGQTMYLGKREILNKEEYQFHADLPRALSRVGRPHAQEKPGVVFCYSRFP